MKNTPHSTQALFQLNGIPPIGISLSMALQHLVAMIVGCVTPAIIIANVVGLPQAERVLLIQASLVMSAVTTLLELFPIGGKFGAGLPVMFGVSFAYLPSMQSIAAGGGGIASIAGAMIVGGVIKLIPLTGVTMPYISYGGSSMLSCMLMLGILQGVSVAVGEQEEAEWRLAREVEEA